MTAFVPMVLLACPSCDDGPAADPTFQPLGTFAPRAMADEAGVDAGPRDATLADAASDDSTDAADASDTSLPRIYPVCPDAMAPSFGSISSQLLTNYNTCGGAQNECHSSYGALPIFEGGGGSRLDFSVDAQDLYAELLGFDGGGYPSTNVYNEAGTVVLRVAPGDAAASMLYIKVALPTVFDSRYGFVMPPNGLGSLVCPAALDSIKTWIDNGAPPN